MGSPPLGPLDSFGKFLNSFKKLCNTFESNHHKLMREDFNNKYINCWFLFILFFFFIKFKYETIYLIKINSVAHYSRAFLDGSLMIGMLLGELVGFEFFHFLHVFHLPFSLFLFFWIKFFILINRLFNFILIYFRFIFILRIKILEPFSIVCVALLVICTIPRLGPDSTHPHDSSCLLWTFFYPIHFIRRHDVSQFVLYVSRQITDYWFIQRLIVLLHCC